MRMGTLTSPPPLKHPTMVDIAWAAGFIEGEGSFSGRRKNQRTEAVVVNQVQREPLNRLRDWFGGSVYSRKKYGGQAGLPYFCWQVTGSRARGLMLTIFSFMSPKRRQQISLAMKGEKK